MSAPSHTARTVNRTDLTAGVVVVAGSLVFAYMALGYGIGSVRQMGAGFFPLALGLLGAVLGAVVAIRAVTLPSREEAEIDLRQFLFVASAFVVFALGIEPAGHFVTMVLTAMVGSLAYRDSTLAGSLLLGIGIAIATWLIFIVLLGLPIPLWPRFA